MKIFFVRNVPDNIPWPLKVFPVMPVVIFPRKIMKISCFFLPVCHCGTLYNKSIIPCSRPNTALWRPAVRQLQSDGFRWLIAPQAPLEESATTEASRRCSLTGMLAGFRSHFGSKFLTCLRAVSAFWLSKTWSRSCSGSARFCLSVCVSVIPFDFLQAHFWTDSGQNSFVISEKRSPKNGNLNRFL